MIEIAHLTKRYGALTAVDDVSFRVAPGEVLGRVQPGLEQGQALARKILDLVIELFQLALRQFQALLRRPSVGGAVLVDVDQSLQLLAPPLRIEP